MGLGKAREEARKGEETEYTQVVGVTVWHLPIASCHAATSDHVAHVADHASALAIARSLLDEVADPRWADDGGPRLALTRCHGGLSSGKMQH